MTSIVYVDVVGGAAGDMLLAALVDAGASWDAVAAAVEAVLPGRFELATEVVRRGGLRARKLRIELGPNAPASSELEPRPVGDLIAAVERSALAPRVAEDARRALEALGAAEARVHGEDDPGLHELGDDDTLLDVVGVAAALESLGARGLLVSAVPLEAGGTIPARHGHPPLPLPAPVTLELLRGFRTRAGGEGEVVTPTAAALFAALGTPASGYPEMTIGSTGYGAGTSDPPDRPNVVRVVVGSEAAAATEAPGRELVVLETNLDDLSGELVADAVRALLRAGALDAWTMPIQMKKGRPGILLSALADPKMEPRVRAAFFEATTTFGVRSHRVTRSELERRMVSVELSEGSVRVKLGLLGSRVVTATPEHDDVAALADLTGRAVRIVYEEATVAARALRFESTKR